MEEDVVDLNDMWSGFDLKSQKQNSRCLAVNTILAGKYLVGPVLGQGGFGITYMGYDLNMETKIAIKEYFPVELVSRDTTTMHGDKVLSLSGEKSVTYRQGLKKYVAEAQNVSQFSEVPGVVSVKDFFYENETAYIVMEYIDGISLKDYLKEKGKKLSEEETLAIMKPVLEALGKVHDAGIIHRDISPDNIMLTFEADQGASENSESNESVGARSANTMSLVDGIRNGQGIGRKIKSVKLIDFGAARMTAKNDQKSLTIILKHGYAPEEQYRTHGEQGPWTDVYAVCAVLYRMLTGETPVPAMDRMFKDELKSFEALGVNISANTAMAILKGLAVKKDDRIRSVQELIAVLYEGAGVKAVCGNRDRRKRYGIAGICGAAVLTICIFTVTFVMRGAHSNPGLNAEKSGQKNQTVESSDPNNAVDPTVAESAIYSEGEIELSFEESDLGEVIAYWNPQTSISGDYGDHILICMQDGNVKAMGSNSYGQCMVENWSDIVAVASSSYHSLGLRCDGRVFAEGNNASGQCEVGSWTDVIQIAAGSNSSYGLTTQGMVLCAGRDDGQMKEIAEWTNIKAITTGLNDVLIGLDEDGSLHYVGNDTDWPAVSGWQDVVYIDYEGFSVLGIKEDGSYVIAQLSDSDSEWLASNMGEWADIQQISTNGPILAVNKEGKVLSKLSSEMDEQEEMQAVISRWTDMSAVTSLCGSDRIYIVGLKQDGTIIEYEQCYGDADLTSEKLNWISTMDLGYGYENLVAGTKDGRILAYGLENFRLDQFTALNESAEIPASKVKAIVGMDAVLMEDGRLVYCGLFANDYRNQAIAENVVQALELWPLGRGYGYAILTEDGRVQLKVLDETKSASRDMESVKDALEWTDVVQITGSGYNLFGLHKDGSVSVAGKDITAGGFVKIQSNEFLSGTAKELVGIKEDGSAEVIISTESSVAFGRTQISTWDNLVDICLGESHVVGLKKDGTVVAVGSNHAGQCDVEDWTDIVYLKAGKNCTLGITADGELKTAGSFY